MKQHPLSAAFPAMHEDELAVSWLGVQPDGDHILSFGVDPDKKHPGHWGLTRFSTADPHTLDEIRRPVRADYVPAFLRAMGADDSAVWKRQPAPAPHVAAALNALSAAEPRVYFMVADRFVKIGWTVDLRNRLRELQTGCPFTLALRAAISGGQPLEAELHRRFRAYRVRSGNEWFRLEGELADYIESLPIV